MPLLLQLIWLRIRLKATLWRADAVSLARLGMAFVAWQFWRTLRRLLDCVLPRRK